MRKNSPYHFVRGVGKEALDEAFDRDRVSWGMSYEKDRPNDYHCRMVCYVLKARTAREALFRTLDLLHANLTQTRDASAPRIPAWALPFRDELGRLVIGSSAPYGKVYFRVGFAPSNKARGLLAIHEAAMAWAAELSRRLKNVTARATRQAERLDRNVARCNAHWASKPMPRTWGAAAKGGKK